MKDKLLNTRVMYLRELHRALVWNCEEEELSDIMKDYSDFFILGTQQGKSEEQICKELGNPVDIVIDMHLSNKKGESSYPPISRSRSMRIILIFALFILATTTIMNWQTITYSGYVLIGIAAAVPFIIWAVWYCLGGNLFCLNYYINQHHIRTKPYMTHYAISFIVILLFYIIVGSILFIWIDQGVPTILKPERVGELISYIMEFLFLVTLLVMIIGLLKFRKDSVVYYSFICLGIGSIGTILNYLCVSHILISEISYKTNIILSLLPYLVGTLSSIIFLIYLYHTSNRKEKNEWMHN